MLDKLNIKIFADTANLHEMRVQERVDGFTTNPTLMRKAGVTDYRTFATNALEFAGDRPVSFEVFADDLRGMAQQAYEISSWGENAFVKIPITTTRGEFTGPIIRELHLRGVCLNVTAVFTPQQVEWVMAEIDGDGSGPIGPPAIISVFAGRVANAGVDPGDNMSDCLSVMFPTHVELLWASPRQVYDVVEAERVGCQIITLTPALIDQLPLLGKNLEEYSLETVRMFYDDAQAAGYEL